MNIAKQIALIFLALLTLAASPASADEDFSAYGGQKIRNITFNLIDCPWNGYDLQVLAYDMLSLNYNDSFSVELYEQSLAKLRASDRYEQVSGQVVQVDGGVELFFELKPNLVLKDISIKGCYPLFKDEVTKASGLNIGEPINAELLKGYEDQIRSLYVREGFIAPQVSSILKPDNAHGTATLAISIAPGDCYRLKSLRVSGNRHLSDNVIAARMQSWWGRFFVSEGRRFRLSAFEDDIKQLKNYYWRKGYAECDLSYTLERDESARSVKALINIKEGPLYIAKIRGNHGLRDRQLKKQLIFQTQGNRRERNLLKSLESIREIYHAEGYLDASVSVAKNDTVKRGYPASEITFTVDEGRRSTIAGVKFSGNRAFSARQLRSVMPSLKGLLGRKPYVPEMIDVDLAAIQTLYREAGYNEARLTQEAAVDGHRVTLNIAITEGPQTKLSDISIKGFEAQQLAAAIEATGLKAGAPLSAQRLKQAENNLAQHVSDQGYPHVAVSSASSLNADHTKASLEFMVDKGPFVRMGDTFFQGNFKTRKRTLRHAIDFKPGEPFSLSRMYKAQRDVRDMGIFENVKFKTLGLKEKDERVSLIVDVEEVAPYYLQGGAGYTSDRGLYAATRIGDRNLKGLNLDAWVGGEVSQIGHKTDIHISQRRTLGTPFSTTYNYTYERKEEFNQDFGTRVSGASLLIGRSFDDIKIKTGFEVRYENRRAFPTETGAIIPASFVTRNILVGTPTLIYDSRDSFVRPRKGIYTTLSVDGSRGIGNNYDDFIKYRANLRYYWSPEDWLTFAVAADYAHIDLVGRDELITKDQLLYSGGTLSVRGYDENMLRHDKDDNSIGGLTRLGGSLEARFQMSQHWELSLFLDSGAIREAPEASGSDGFKSTAGLGLRYMTPIGPMGLLYGYKLNPEDGDSRGRFHFSLGYTF